MPHFLPLLALLITFSASPALASDKNVQIRLLPEKTELKGGDTVTVGIEETIAPSWHTYWSNPGDSGTIARIAWKGIDGLEAAPIQWPLPKKMPIGPLTNYGYEEKVVLLQDLTLPKNLPEGPQTISATIDILVCHEICIPESHEASFTINNGSDSYSEAIAEARSFLPVEMGWATTLAEEAGDLMVTITTDMPSAFSTIETFNLNT